MSQMTQIAGKEAPRAVVVDSITYHLRKDATDSATTFDRSRVHILESGCEKIADGAHVCYLFGIVSPTAGTLETPVSVMYIGFHPQKISMSPSALTAQDLDRMHVYTSDARGFVGRFAAGFLGLNRADDTEKRDLISPYPENLIVSDSDEA